MYNMKKGRYDQNKNKKNNRDVISYEDMKKATNLK